jgi:hypothetical protein
VAVRPATEDGMQAGKHSQAIATKVLPPRGVGLIERSRLLELVTQVPMKPLSVIKAPAGFGKTSLAVAWADQLLLPAPGGGSCLRGCEQILIRCGQPTRYLTDCIKERGRFIGLSLGCNNEVCAGRFIGFVSAEHPLGSVEGHRSSSCGKSDLLI